MLGLIGLAGDFDHAIVFAGQHVQRDSFLGILRSFARRHLVRLPVNNDRAFLVGGVAFCVVVAVVVVVERLGGQE